MAKRTIRCSYCGIEGHHITTCHVKADGREPDDLDLEVCNVVPRNKHEFYAGDVRRAVYRMLRRAYGGN